mgnify:CR=1 FL=1
MKIDGKQLINLKPAELGKQLYMVIKLLIVYLPGYQART